MLWFMSDHPVPGRRSFGGLDYIKITLLSLAITALWQSMHSIILPMRILDFVAENQKNTYLGLLTFVGLILAMLVQPVAGAYSDRSGFVRGRRMPYILGGVTGLLIFLAVFGFAPNYAVLFASYCFMQIASNVVQGAYQAYLPELVPQNRRGLASGIKSVMEIVGGAVMVLVSPRLMGHYTAGEGTYWLWLTLGILGAVMLFAGLATIFWVKESPPATLSISNKPVENPLAGIFKLDLKRDIPFIWFLISRLLVFMGLTTIQQFALYFFKDVVGVADPAQASANFIVISVAGMVLAAYPAGRLSDNKGRKPVAVISAFLGAIAVLLIIILPKEYDWLRFPALLLGLALGAFSTTNWAMATDLVPVGGEARYLGIANMATAGGAALARLIGPVIDFFNGRSYNLGYQVMLICCLVYFVLGGLLLLKVKNQTRPGN
jgi:MFS family permease